MNAKNLVVFFLAVLLAGDVSRGQTSGEELAQLEKQFIEMPVEARRMTGPLFWLHGDESRERLESYLDKVAESHNGTFCTESRPHKDWLGEGWYRDLAICLEAAKKHRLTMWVFDEQWWPSQMVGGKVPEQYSAKTLHATAATVEGPKAVSEQGFDHSLVAVVAGKELEGGLVDGQSLVDLSSSVHNGTLTWNAPVGRWKLMKFTWKYTGPVGYQKKWLSVDGASRDCVDWFLRTVYQPHFDRFGADFGKTIVGYFYDEPETQGDWGTEVPKVLAERGVDLKKALVSYKFQLVGDEQAAARYAYLEAFAEAWGRVLYGGMAQWCREHKVISMGHFMEHDKCLFDRRLCAGNMFQLQKYSDMGGIDLVCRQVYPGQRKMGLYQMPKIASSISHVYGKADDIAFSEIFGAYGQDLTYPQMKWLTDWHQVRGVNMLISHSFNPRAPLDTDCPPFFYNGGHEPRYPLYKVWADYNSRLGTMLSGGRHVCPVAFLYLGQSYHAGKHVRPELLTSAMQDALFDCDWLPYDAFDEAKLDGRQIKLHQENYRILVVPAAEVIPYATLAKAKTFFDQGGVVVAYGILPSKSATVGKSSAEIAVVTEAVWGTTTPSLSVCKTNAAGGRSYFLPQEPSSEDLQKVLTADGGVHPTLQVLQGETNHWLHVLHRVKAGRDLFLVCNQDHLGAARKFTLHVNAQGVPECWDAMRGAITSIPCRRQGAWADVDLTLEPSESVLVVFSPQERTGNQKRPSRLDASQVPATTLAVEVDPSAPIEKEPTLPTAVGPNGKPRPLTKSPVRANPFHGKVAVPETISLATSRVYLEMEGLAPEEAAQVTVNGRNAGGVIGKPLQVDVARYLKPGSNTIRIVPFTPKQVRLAVYPIGQ